MRLSVIICVYNTPSELLAECVGSIRGSTLDKDSYEILLIDDGSTVDYTDLIEEYSLRSIKTENRGIFAARILAIREAKGEYIAYVDSDDTVSFNYHRPMLECAEESRADIVYNDWAFHTSRARYYLRRDTTISSDISAEGEDILSLFLKSSGREHSYSVLWNKLYRRDLLLSVADALDALNIPDSFNYSEDTLVNFYAHKMAKSVRNIHTGYYFYRSHPQQTVAVTSREKLLSHIDNMSFTLGEMERIICTLPDAETLLPCVREWSAMMARTHYSYASAEDYTDLFPKIREAYSVDELSPSTFADGEVYHDTVLLAENLAEIDSALTEIWNSDGEVAVAPTKDAYTLAALEYMRGVGKPISLERCGVKIPTPRIRLMSRILHNRLLYKLGMILFPKGSPIRRALKNKL